MNKQMPESDGQSSFDIDSDPLEAMSRAANKLAVAGQTRLADRLILATRAVEALVDAASAGEDQQPEYAVSKPLWFGPHRATLLRNALTPFAAQPAQGPVHE